MAIRRLVLAAAAMVPVLLMMAQPAAASWLEQGTPVLQGVADWQLNAVSCTSPTSCMAVGNTGLSGGNLIAEQRSGTTWALVNIPGSGELTSISCTSATACEAVGDTGGALLAERWDGRSWTVQTTPSPAGATRSFLLGVSCTAANACTAVGFYDDSAGNQRTLAERWDGSNWTIQTTPNPSGSTTSQLNEVSCSSATACTAVGSATGQTWAEAWNGTTWTIQTTPIPAGGSDPALHGVSCAAPKACTAVGSFFNGANTVPLADRWNGTKWTPQTAAVPAGSTAAGFSSVSCVAAKTSTGCNAVGFNTGDGSPAALAETWDGKTWSVPDFHGPPNSQTSDLSGVSCSSLTACMSAGASTDNTAGLETPLAEQYS